MFIVTRPMIFKTCKALNFFNKSHSAVLIKSTFEVLSTARFTNAVSPEESTKAEKVPNKIVAKEIEHKVTEAVGKDSVVNLKSLFQVKKPHTVGVSFLWDHACAKKVVKKVLQGVKPDECVVLESNPGFGFTTVNFIEAGIPKVYIFQAHFPATKFYEKNVDRTKSFQHSIFYRHGLQDNIVLSIFEEAVNSGKICKILGVATNHKFLSSLPRQVLNKNLWDLSDSIEFYIIVSEQVYNKITNFRLTLTRFFTYCLFSCLFDLELLEVYPTSSFLPVLQTNAMYLVKIKKKKNECMKINPELIPEYTTFLKILGTSKSNLIIQTLERWVPGCGLNFISKGICLTTAVKEISANESITLFNFFTECEGYENFKVMHKLLQNEERIKENKDKDE